MTPRGNLPNLRPIFQNMTYRCDCSFFLVMKMIKYTDDILCTIFLALVSDNGAYTATKEHYILA
jgi:hypothetical protein